MARLPSNTSILHSNPSASAPGKITIAHAQLRDLIVCPQERGIVNYVRARTIVEHNLLHANSRTRRLCNLSFVPNTIASLSLSDTTTLIAAGGPEADFSLSLHTWHTDGYDGPSHDSSPSSFRWQYETRLEGQINNAVLLTSMNLSGSHESSAEPMVVVSNNDSSIKFYHIAVRAGQGVEGHAGRIEQAGILKLNTAVNHSSISPDGRTILSVGDSLDVHLNRITGGHYLSFAPITTLSLPDNIPRSAASVPASFSTAFSADGSKFAVASQEGVVAVWDVRSSKPLKVFTTDRSRVSNRIEAPDQLTTGLWCGEAVHDWALRSVKFGGQPGKEIMTFTEHTSLLHVVDARTFETHEIIRVPPISGIRPLTHIPAGNAGLGAEDSIGDDIENSPRSRLLRVRARPHGIRPTHTPHPPRAASPEARMGIDALNETFGQDVERMRARIRVVERAGREHAIMDEEDEDDYEGDDTAELDLDCLPSDAPSRSVSPIFPRPISQTRSPLARIFSRSPDLAASIDPYADTPSPYHTLYPSDAQYARFPAGPSSHSRGRRIGGETSSGLHETGEDVHLAGVCFDPSGSYIYTGSSNGICEFSIRDAGKRWWFGSSWA